MTVLHVKDNNMIKKVEHRLTEERTYFKPFNYPWAYDAWLKHEQSHWLHTEVPMLEDVKDWKKKVTNEEKHFLTQIRSEEHTSELQSH